MPQDWYKYPILQSNDYATIYKGPGTDTPHFAADVQTPEGTDITSLFGGKVTQAGCRPWGGEAFVNTIDPTNINNPNGIDFYVYHLEEVDVKAGDTIKPGTKLGVSGGEQRGKCPTNPRYSTGAHSHVGFFDPNFSGKSPAPGNYNVSHGIAHTPGGNINYGPDVTPYIQTAKVTGISNDLGTIASNVSSSTFGAWFDSIKSSLGITSNKDLLYRVGFLGLGTLLIIVGIVMLAKSVSSGVAQTAIQAAT